MKPSSGKVPIKQSFLRKTVLNASGLRESGSKYMESATQSLIIIWTKIQLCVLNLSNKWKSKTAGWGGIKQEGPNNSKKQDTGSQE